MELIAGLSRTSVLALRYVVRLPPTGR